MGSDLEYPPPVQNKSTGMEDSWTPFEETLYRAAAEQLKLFSNLHAAERFYGFTFDCNADYGDILLCANSEEDLRKTIRDHYSHYDEAELSRLRWNAGDWAHQGFFGYDDPLSKAWNRQWREFKKMVGDSYEEWLYGMMADEDDEFSDHFMAAVCRTLIRLECGHAFDVLPQAESFCTFVNDHDEADETSWLRLAKIRLAMSPDFPATPLAGIRVTGQQPELAGAYLALSADLFDGGEPKRAWHLLAEAARLDERIVGRFRQRSPSSSQVEFPVPDAAELTLPAEPSYLRGCALAARAKLGRSVAERDAVLDDLTRAIDLDPQNEEALRRRGEHYSNTAFLKNRPELLDLAVTDFNRLLELRPNDPKYLRARAGTHQNGLRRDYLGVLADLSRAMELSTPTPDDFADRGWALLNLGRFEEAIAEYTQALESRGPPQGWNYAWRMDLRHRGKCYFRLGRFEEALRDFAALFELAPKESEEALLFQSQVLAKLERTEEADAALQRARKQKSDVERHYANWLMED